MIETIIEFDTRAFLAINNLFDNRLVDLIMLTMSARRFWLAVIILIASSISLKKNWADLKRVLLFLAVMASCDVVTAYVLKNTFQRQRPCYALESVRLVTESCGSRFGFPSNHASNGTAVATMIILLWRKRWQVLLIVPVVATVCYSRIHLGVHYPLDVLLGALFGALYAFSVYEILARKFPVLVTVPQ